MVRLNKKIETATEDFNKDQNVETFLLTVTYNENMQNHFKERIYIEEIDSEFADYANDEDEDTEIIPNDFREESNFRQAFPRSCIRNKK